MDGNLRKFDPVKLAGKGFSSVATITPILYLMVSIPALHDSRFLVGLLGVASAALVFVASFNKQYIYCPTFIRKTMLWIGSRSYGIYVIHMPVIYFIQESTIRYYISIGQGPSKTVLLCAVMTLLAITTTIILTEINYQIIEKPLRKIGRKYAQKNQQLKTGPDLWPACHG